MPQQTQIRLGRDEFREEIQNIIIKEEAATTHFLLPHILQNLTTNRNQSLILSHLLLTLQNVAMSFDFPFYGHYLRQVTIATGGTFWFSNRCSSDLSCSSELFCHATRYTQVLHICPSGHFQGLSSLGTLLTVCWPQHSTSPHWWLILTPVTPKTPLCNTWIMVALHLIFELYVDCCLTSAWFKYNCRNLTEHQCYPLFRPEFQQSVSISALNTC